MLARFIAVTITALVCIAALWVVLVRGCMTQHSRPIGQQDISIDVSPDDKMLVFTANGAGGRDLYLLRADAPHVVRIAETPAYEVDPCFSPDGQLVAYAAGLPGDRADHVFVRPVDGGPAYQLTDTGANDSTPRFSPDGSLIAFARDKTYNWGGLAANWSAGGVICVVGIDGTGERELTPDETFAWDPQFLPDGRSLIFTVIGADGSMHQACVPVDGSAPYRETTGIVWATRSADGKLITYSEGQYSPDLKLYVANADGTDVRWIAQSLSGVCKPVFDRGGDHIYFFVEEWKTGPTGVPSYNLWKIGVDGEGLRMVADSRLFEDPLNWSP